MDWKPTEEQLARIEDKEDLAIVQSLQASDIQLIDSWLLRCASSNWQKVAMVVGAALEISDSENILTNVPDIFFGIRIEELVMNHLLNSEGDLTKMRASEVKLAT